MKKWITGIFILCVLLIAGTYLFIPNQVVVSKTVLINTNQNAIYRSLINQSNWANWWPDTKKNKEEIKDPYGFQYGSYHYQVQQQHYNILGINIQNNRSVINSIVKILTLKSDTSALQWQCTLTTGFNPFNKILKYQQAVQIKKNMTAILDHLQHYLNNPENVYGITIYKNTVKDTLLIATRFQTTAYPATASIYEYIDKLKAYIKQQGATQTNYPMLHVNRLDKDKFETMIAIPVDKALPGEGNFFFRRMVPGNILETEIKGGAGTIKSAFTQMGNYVQDLHLQSPAIPFESLVTDRTREMDTTKWITKISYPIF